MLKKLGLLLLLCCTVSPLWAAGEASYETLQIKPVAENDGDTFATFNVTLDSYTPKLIDAGNVLNSTTNILMPTLRKRTIKNTSAQVVYLSSAAAFNSNFTNFGYILGEATNTATSNQYTTWGTGPIYGACFATNPSCTVNVIKETNSAY